MMRPSVAGTNRNRNRGLPVDLNFHAATQTIAAPIAMVREPRHHRFVAELQRSNLFQQVIFRRYQ
jgi:hypothetical protein